MNEGSDFHGEDIPGDDFRDLPVPPRPPRGTRPRAHPLTLAAVAVAGATIGVAAVLIVGAGTGSTAATGAPASPGPASPAPAQGGGSHGADPYGGVPSALPPLSGTGAGLQVMLGGRVTAVSATSITIGGRGPSVTAKITKATRFTGNVHSVTGVKVGDQVSAVLSGASASSLTATTIQDLGAAPQ